MAAKKYAFFSMKINSGVGKYYRVGPLNVGLMPISIDIQYETISIAGPIQSAEVPCEKLVTAQMLTRPHQLSEIYL